MIEDYGTLSEEEILEEIIQELEEETDLVIDNLQLHFEDGKLLVHGSLNNDEEMEELVNLLDNHLDSQDYELEVEVAQGSGGVIPPTAFEKSGDSSPRDFADESLENLAEEEMDFVDEDGFDDEKW